jgi:hypothetical protein
MIEIQPPDKVFGAAYSAMSTPAFFNDAVPNPVPHAMAPPTASSKFLPEAFP